MYVEDQDVVEFTPVKLVLQSQDEVDLIRFLLGKMSQEKTDMLGFKVNCFAMYESLGNVYKNYPIDGGEFIYRTWGG